MPSISQALDQATSEGIVTMEQAARLRDLMAAQGLGGVAGNTDGEAASMPEETEAPRFLRGFHDILITIGVIAALGGLWGLASAGAMGPVIGPVATLLSIIPLAEFLVRRQRLALPAFVLTVFTVVAAGYLGEALSGDIKFRFGEEAGGAIAALLAVGALAPFYWRYKVPAALAAMIAAAAGFAFLTSLTLLGGNEPPSPRLAGLLGLVFSAALFAIAMRFDLSDRLRRTRRSDVGFWLHMIAAPSLLYSAFALMFGIAGFSDAGPASPQAQTAIMALGVIIALMATGIIIDRRAFVTSGLISLGVALYALFFQAGISATGLTPFVVLMVGITVLLLGTGWVRLRAILLGLFPHSLREMLPPVRR